jgi:hypothetical protein
MNNVIFNHLNNAIQSLEILQLNLTYDSESRSSVEQLLLEVKWTNCLQNLIDVVNFHPLRNFSLKLELECDDNDKYHHHIQHRYKLNENRHGNLNL